MADNRGSLPGMYGCDFDLVNHFLIVNPCCLGRRGTRFPDSSLSSSSGRGGLTRTVELLFAVWIGGSRTPLREPTVEGG